MALRRPLAAPSFFSKHTLTPRHGRNLMQWPLDPSSPLYHKKISTKIPRFYEKQYTPKNTPQISKKTKHQKHGILVMADLHFLPITEFLFPTPTLYPASTLQGRSGIMPNGQPRSVSKHPAWCSHIYPLGLLIVLKDQESHSTLQFHPYSLHVLEQSWSLSI